uniref:Interleukin n=1 Tax=Oreochromis aureus TaxID=47969 RepID=A0AAZ1XW71_OREAU
MKHFIRIAFWIVTIAVFCWNTQGKPISKPLIEMSDLTLLKNVSCIDGSEFYAPENIEKECFINALNCVTSELEKANKSEECPESGVGILQGLEVLDRIIGQLNRKNLTPHNSSKCNCHLWPEKNFASFADDIMTLLHKINTEV